MRLIVICLISQVVGLAQSTIDLREIVLRSVSRDWRDLEARRNYTFIRHTREKQYNGSVATSDEYKTFEVTILYGQPYSRLIAKDGKPLTTDDEHKQKEKLDREMAKRACESERDRAKREEQDKKDLEEERQVRREIADAFDFKLLRDEIVSGFPAWVIQAEPKPGYRPKTARAKILPKIRGTLWITKADYRWVKVDAEVIDTFSYGFMLFKLYPGTRLTFEQVKVNDDVWLPRKAHIRGFARVAMVKKYDLEIETHWEDYRRFSADSRVVATAEPETPTAKSAP
ncbi:MAG: hypothetical protein IT168_31215 [Bryobacterales bacterium]|nr:hypothetical protein [Bryobacterales bacterium]